MLIEESKLEYWINNFYGYGSWNARFWFIGHEDTGGEVPEEVAEKINYFQKAHRPTDDGVLCDIREVYKHVAFRWEGPKAGSYANRYEYRFGTDATQSVIWKNLIAFAHGYRNENLPDLLTYQKQSFASSVNPQEAVISLYPLPGPHTHSWYYNWLGLPNLAYLKSRSVYEEHLYQRRIQVVLSNIRTYKPEVVLMFGMKNINALKKSVQDFFSDAKFKMIKATKLQIPQHHRADFNGTTLLITTQIPALRHQRVETGFDWEEFGKRVRSHP
jgi:hypothetical protein